LERKRNGIAQRFVPSFHITVLNGNFCSANQHDCADVDSARWMAIRGALAIGVDQIAEDKPFFGAEITVEEGSCRVGHYVVAIGLSSLKE
jgi:hypothetical protein